MSEPWELPHGWRWSTMGEVAKVVGGSTPKTSESSYWGDAIPWITPDDLSGFTHKYIERGRRSITHAGYDSCSTQMMPAGTVLFTSRAPIGYVAIAAKPVCTNQGFKSFICGRDVIPDYVYWYLRGSTDLARSYASGTTFLELSATAAARLPIPVPPVAVQRGIVDRIEETLPKTEAARDALASAKSKIRDYRRTILSRAFAPAETSDVDGSPTPAGWRWVTIGDISLRVTKGTTPTSVGFKYTLAGIRFVKAESLGGGSSTTRSARSLTTKRMKHWRGPVLWPATCFSRSPERWDEVRSFERWTCQQTRTRPLPLSDCETRSSPSTSVIGCRRLRWGSS